MIVEATITVLVSDLYRAIRFYVDTLGLTLKKQFNFKYAEVQVGGLVLGLHVSVKLQEKGICRLASELRISKQG